MISAEKQYTGKEAYHIYIFSNSSYFLFFLDRISRGCLLLLFCVKIILSVNLNN